jgi:hypothetical protein
MKDIFLTVDLVFHIILLIANTEQKLEYFIFWADFFADKESNALIINRNETQF